MFAHGSGSSRFSPRNRSVARFLNDAGLATLLLDLLTPSEAELDAHTVVGHMARVGESAVVSRSVLHAGATLGEGARVDGSILGAGSAVGKGAVVTASVLAEDARIRKGADVRGARVGPGATAG